MTGFVEYIIIIVAASYGLGRTFDEVDEDDAGVIGKASFHCTSEERSLTQLLAGDCVGSFILCHAGAYQMLRGYVVPQALRDQHEEKAARV